MIDSRTSRSLSARTPSIALSLAALSVLIGICAAIWSVCQPILPHKKFEPTTYTTHCVDTTTMTVLMRTSSARPCQRVARCIDVVRKAVVLLAPRLHRMRILESRSPGLTRPCDALTFVACITPCSSKDMRVRAFMRKSHPSRPTREPSQPPVWVLALPNCTKAKLSSRPSCFRSSIY